MQNGSKQACLRTATYTTPHSGQMCHRELPAPRISLHHHEERRLQTPPNPTFPDLRVQPDILNTWELIGHHGLLPMMIPKRERMPTTIPGKR